MLSQRPIARRGLTLVEVLIALTILAAALLPMIVGFSQALITTGNSTIAATATSIAQEKMEELKAKPFADLQSRGREPRDLNGGDSFFEVEVTVDTVRPDDARHGGLKMAAVSVYRAGDDQAVVVLSSYFAPFGI